MEITIRCQNPRPFRFPEQPKLPEGQLTRGEVSRQVDQFLVDNERWCGLNDAGRATHYHRAADGT